MHKGKLTNVNPPRITTEPGFGEYRTIQDYPIRGRATYLHVRKRKWPDKSSNEIFSYDWDLSEFDGTRLNSEFVSFLKEGD